MLEDGELHRRRLHAILVYLWHDAIAAGPEWYPLDPVQPGPHRHWLSYSANEVQNGPASARLILASTCRWIASKPPARPQGSAAAWSTGTWPSIAGWPRGEQPSIADVALTPTWPSPRGGLALDRYPALNAWIARIRALPGRIPMPGLAGGGRHEPGTESLPRRRTGDRGNAPAFANRSPASAAARDPHLHAGPAPGVLLPAIAVAGGRHWRRRLPRSSRCSGAPPGFARSPEPTRLRIDNLPQADDPLAANLEAGTPPRHPRPGMADPPPQTALNGRVLARDGKGFTVGVEHPFETVPSTSRRAAISPSPGS